MRNYHFLNLNISTRRHYAIKHENYVRHLFAFVEVAGSGLFHDIFHVVFAHLWIHLTDDSSTIEFVLFVLSFEKGNTGLNRKIWPEHLLLTVLRYIASGNSPLV